MKKKQFIAVLSVLIVVVSNVKAQQADLFTTAEDENWSHSSVNTMTAIVPDVVIYTDSVLQDVDGFGGSFSERAWDAMQVLTTQQRFNLMSELFGTDGINFSWGRTPVGGNDFSLSTYTYNDVPNDWEQRNFSIARDRYILLPMIKLAKQIRPNLKLWASPWTPPYWMKISEHYSLKSHGINGTEQAHNRLDPNYQVAMNVTAFKMMDGFLHSYAVYLSKYLQEYEKEGVKIDILMPQNEVQWEPCWQCCTWRPEDLAIFVAQYLGPQLEKERIDTQLWLGTINYPKPEWVFRFFENDKVKKYIHGIGMQWTGMQAMPKVHEQMPEMKLMQTEGVCGDGDNDWKDMEKSWERIVHCFNSGASMYMQWNMVLDDGLESLFEWKQNALVIVNRKDGHITRTPEYWMMKHFSHFIQPHSVLLRTHGYEDLLAFKTQKGNIVVVFYNKDNNVNNLSLKIGDNCFALKIKPKSLNTLIL